MNKLENGKYLNRLYDDFSNLFKNQTQILESSVKLSYLVPKKEKIYFRDLIDILIIVSSKISKIQSRDIETIEKFIVYLKHTQLFDDNASSLNEIKITLIKIAKRINFSLWLYEQFLKIKKPKLIIVEDGHYLGYITILLAAKKLGIKTAEYQHGYMGLAHPAYNYHTNIFKDIQPFLPEYLLTHGEVS